MTTENQPIRVLQATVSNDKGGLTGYIFQNYRYMKKKQVQFDFLTYETELDFRAEFEKWEPDFLLFRSYLIFLLITMH
jgi:membrane protein YqaA with SNARE-associated domain